MKRNKLIIILIGIIIASIYLIALSVNRVIRLTEMHSCGCCVCSEPDMFRIVLSFITIILGVVGVVCGFLEVVRQKKMRK